MLSNLALGVLAVLQASPPPKIVFIPTSQVIDIARSVARGEGYSLANRDKYFFDVISDKDGRPVFPGYITVGFYWNSDTVNAISINENTGQVLDRSLCLSFEYPEVLRSGQEIRKATGASLLPLPDLLKQTGCDSLKRLRVPRKNP